MTDDEANYYKQSYAVWPFALTSSSVAIFFKFYGLIYDRTIDCGEKRYTLQQERFPGRVAYNVGELMGQVIGPLADMYSIAAIIIIAG